MTASLTVRNLFDEDYESIFVSSVSDDFAFRYPGAPRSFLASVAYEL